MEEKLDPCSVKLLENKKTELENLRKGKLRGKEVRSRIQWKEEGEKPSSYFCGLEAKNFTSKIIPKVEKENGEIISDQNGIFVEVKNFYEELYQCKNNDHGSNMRNIQDRYWFKETHSWGEFWFGG